MNSKDFNICFPINHSHREASKEEYTNNKLYRIKECFICNKNLQETTKISIQCNKYSSTETKSITDEKKNLLESIFSNQSIENKYYLPKEIQDIIFDFCITKISTNIITKIDKDSLNHIKTCSRCSIKWLLFTSINCCSHHIIPRYSSKILYNNLLNNYA